VTQKKFTQNALLAPVLFIIITIITVVRCMHLSGFKTLKFKSHSRHFIRTTTIARHTPPFVGLVLVPQGDCRSGHTPQL
jgi:hypothetical protein